MSDLDLKSAKLVPTSLGLPTPTPTGGAAGSIDFDSPGITATGSVVLHGHAGEALAGWMLGYIQLKFIATDYARYRGNTVSLGSVLVSRSNLILCRDTDVGSKELWYDPVTAGIDGNGFGTQVLPAGTVMPGGGTFTLSADFGDAPERPFRNVVKNSATGVDNFLHHADIGLQFCTLLTVRDPGGNFRVLKHVYWNVRWEAHFQRDRAGVPRVRPPGHLQLNVQQAVHSGVPNDPRFKGRELDETLPIATPSPTGSSASA